MKTTCVLNRIIMMLVLLPMVLKAQEDFNIEQIVQITLPKWEKTIAMDIQDNRAYIIDDSVGLRIVDVSEPMIPREIGVFYYQRPLYDVVLVNEHAFLAAGRDGLIIVDAADPTCPVVLGELDDVGNARGITVFDSIVYVAGGDEGLSLVNIANPADPTLAGWILTEDYALKVALSGQYAYVADRAGGLIVYDVQDPEHPRRAGTMEAHGETRDVVIDGNRAYIGETGSIWIVDLQEPTRPARLDSAAVIPQPINIEKHGDVIYVCKQDFKDVGIYTTNGDQIDRLGELAIVSSIGSDYAKDVCIIDQHLFCIAGEGLSSWDISDLETPIHIGNIGYRTTMNHLVSYQDRLFVNTTPFGLMEFDVSDPNHPQIIWREPLRRYTQGGSIIASGFSLFSLDDQNTNYLQIWDITDPDMPAKLGMVRTLYDASDLKVFNNVAYVLDERGTQVDIINVANLSNPIRTSILSGNGDENYYDLIVRSGWGYFGSDDGLLVKDMSDLVDVRNYNAYPSEARVNSLVMDEFTIWAASSQGLTAIDVTDVGRLTCLGSYPWQKYAPQIIRDDDYLFVRSDGAGIEIFNTVEPQSIHLVGRCGSGESFSDFVVDGRTIYTIFPYNSLMIFDCSTAFAIEQEKSAVPTSHTLSTPYPNPFNSTTRISYSLPAAGVVRVAVYDLSGREIARLADGVQVAGTHEAVWKADGMSSGVYVVKLDAGGVVAREKVVLVR